MTHRQSTLGQSYLNLLHAKSLNGSKSIEYKKVFNHVKLIYKKDVSVNTTTETVMKEHPFFLFKADSLARLCWDIYMLILMIYLAISVPFYIGFYVPIAGPLVIIEFSVQISLLLDILVTLNTSFFVKGTLIVSRKRIAWKYLKGWFWSDILSSFPYNWFVKSPFQDEIIYEYGTDFLKLSQILSLVKVLRIFRAIKLIKLTKVKKVLTSIEDSLIDHKFVMLFVFLKLVTFMMLVAHWAACIWHLSAMETSISEPINWKKVFEINSQDSIQTGELYITALYWAFTTMATVGYGDIHPYSTTEMIIGIVTMASSSTIFAYILGTFSSIINSATAKETRHREIIIAVNRYMKKAKLPSDLQFRVRRYLDYIYQSQNKSDIAEENIMQMLSLNLKDEIYTFLHGNIINSCSFFKSGGLSTAILSQLHRILKFEAFAPTDSVFKQGETSRILYFILSGKVNLHHLSTDYSYITLQPRTCFGEIGFFTGKPRTASARCIGFTEFFSVIYEDFEGLISGSSEDMALMEKVKNKCEEEDYTILQISCYLCSKVGHIANSCKLILFNLDKEMQKKSKLNEQEIKSKLVRIENRKELIAKRKQLRMGIKHFKREPVLYDKIKEFVMKKEESLKVNEAKGDMQKKRFSFIYNITESSHEDEDEKIRQPAFDMGLVRSDSSSEEYDNI